MCHIRMIIKWLSLLQAWHCVSCMKLVNAHENSFSCFLFLTDKTIKTTGSSINAIIQFDISMARCKCGQSRAGKRMHHLLWTCNRFSVVHMRSHVHVLWVCCETMAWHWRWPLSTVPSDHPGCYPYLQVINYITKNTKLTNHKEEKNIHENYN